MYRPPRSTRQDGKIEMKKINGNRKEEESGKKDVNRKI
jgi:hypothetical protein